MKGFALFLSLLFVLLLTLLGFALLLLASQHYSVVHFLFERENSRLACESALQEIVERHNRSGENPPFLFDFHNWNGLSLESFLRNGYSISADVSASWSSDGSNILVFSARKSTYVSRRQAEVRQMRMENFALYSNASQDIPLPSLFAGWVFSGGGLHLLQPGAKFAGRVYADVDPAELAVFKNAIPAALDFPEIDRFLSPASLRNWSTNSGVFISGPHPDFWKADHYELNCDELKIEPKSSRWQFSYRGLFIGESALPILSFDGALILTQTVHSTAVLVTKPKTPLYIVAFGELKLATEVGPFEDAGAYHPLALMSTSAVLLSASAPVAARINALVVALGSINVDGREVGLLIEPGGRPLTEQEKQEWLADQAQSEFLLEKEKKESLLLSVETAEKSVWFQGSVICAHSFYFPPDLKQLHFQKSRELYSLLPSLPFVYVVEGSSRWI